MENNQAKYEFVIVQMIKLSDGVAEIVTHMQESFLSLSPSAKKPKLSTHMTIVPPFYATKQMIEGLAVGLKIAKDLYTYEEKEHGRSVIRYGRIINMKFFRNPENDVLVFSLDFPMVYGNFLKTYREHICNFVEFVHPPAGDGSFVPHITIMEGGTLYNDSYNGESIKSPYCQLFQMDEVFGSLKFWPSPPQILMKITEGDKTKWQEVYPKMFDE